MLTSAYLMVATGSFDRYLRGKMATYFIRKPPRNPGYIYVFFFAIDHFTRHIPKSMMPFLSIAKMFLHLRNDLLTIEFNGLHEL